MPAEPGKAEDMGRWRDGQRGFPLKKRRGLYRARRGTRSSGDEEEEEDEEINMVAEREMKPRPSNTRRRRTPASSTRAMVATSGGVALTSTGGAGSLTASGGADAGRVVVKGEEEEEGDVVVAPAPADGNHGVGNGKKRRNPAVLMEGSRCSRVNGRGWRCCQQTLVGYSLCEHHLGKGRLRSVSSVRCNGRARKKEEALDGSALSQQASISPLQQRQQLLLSGDGDCEEEENPGKRRRKKIGMVKARSIRSLLHQPDHPTPTAMAGPEPCPSLSPAPAAGTVIAASTPAHDSYSASVVA